MRSITNNNIIFFLASSSSNSNDVDDMGMLEQQNDQIMLAEETQLTEKDMNQYNALLLATDRIDHTIQMLDEKLCKYKYKSNKIKKGKICWNFFFFFFFFLLVSFNFWKYFYNLCKVILFLSKAFKTSNIIFSRYQKTLFLVLLLFFILIQYKQLIVQIIYKKIRTFSFLFIINFFVSKIIIFFFCSQ